MTRLRHRLARLEARHPRQADPVTVTRILVAPRPGGGAEPVAALIPGRGRITRAEDEPAPAFLARLAEVEGAGP